MLPDGKCSALLGVCSAVLGNYFLNTQSVPRAFSVYRISYRLSILIERTGVSK